MITEKEERGNNTQNDLHNQLSALLNKQGWAEYGTGWVSHNLLKDQNQFEQIEMFLEGATLRLLAEDKVFISICEPYPANRHGYARVTIGVALDEIEQVDQKGTSFPQNAELCLHLARDLQIRAHAIVKKFTVKNS